MPGGYCIGDDVFSLISHSDEHGGFELGTKGTVVRPSDKEPNKMLMVDIEGYGLLLNFWLSDISRDDPCLRQTLERVWKSLVPARTNKNSRKHFWVDSTVSRDQLRPIMTSSKLDINQLDDIWDLADDAGTGALTFSRLGFLLGRWHRASPCIYEHVRASTKGSQKWQLCAGRSVLHPSAHSSHGLN